MRKPEQVETQTIKRAALFVLGVGGLCAFVTYILLMRAPLLMLRMLCVPIGGLTIAALHLGTSELVDEMAFYRVAEVALKSSTVGLS